jgi:hypothetical protein
MFAKLRKQKLKTACRKENGVFQDPVTTASCELPTCISDARMIRWVTDLDLHSVHVHHKIDATPELNKLEKMPSKTSSPPPYETVTSDAQTSATSSRSASEVPSPAQFFSITFVDSDKLRIQPPIPFVVDLVKNCIECFYHLPIQSESHKPEGVTYKLRGNPWIEVFTSDLVSGKTLIVKMLESLKEAHWQVCPSFTWLDHDSSRLLFKYSTHILEKTTCKCFLLLRNSDESNRIWLISGDDKVNRLMQEYAQQNWSSGLKSVKQEVQYATSCVRYTLAETTSLWKSLTCSNDEENGFLLGLFPFFFKHGYELATALKDNNSHSLVFQQTF